MADPKQIMDVAHPNKSAPSGNSKSVIVTHRPMMQDPMVNKDTTESVTVNTAPAKSTKPKLQPASAPVLEAVEADAPDKVAPATHVKLNLKPLVDADAETPSVKESETPSAPDQADTPAAPEKADTPEVDKEKANPEDQGDKGTEVEINPELADQEKAKADAALQKLVDTKKYYLPIKTLEDRRTRRFVIIGLIVSIVMIAAWLNVALDAGLIVIDGVEALTNFF